MFQTVGEIALAAQVRRLEREVRRLKRQHGEDDSDLFIGEPVVSMDLAPNHPKTVTLAKQASWYVEENEYGVPKMTGRTFNGPARNLEMTFYCTPHPATTNDYCNILGELHGLCLKQLVKMYK